MPRTRTSCQTSLLRYELYKKSIEKCHELGQPVPNLCLGIALSLALELSLSLAL